MCVYIYNIYVYSSYMPQSYCGDKLEGTLFFIISLPMYRILLSRLGWCPWLLLGIVRQATKPNMQDC